jgi:hypothetical protein
MKSFSNRMSNRVKACRPVTEVKGRNEGIIVNRPLGSEPVTCWLAQSGVDFVSAERWQGQRGRMELACSLH